MMCTYSKAKGRSIDISDAMGELCVINEEMKGLRLSVQLKAYCGTYSEERRFFYWI
jgi:hypothetical protein